MNNLQTIHIPGRLFLFLLFIFAVSRSVHAQTDDRFSGVWDGAIEIPGTPLNVTVELSRNNDGSLKGNIDIPLQSARDLPLSNLSVNGDAVTFVISGVPGTPTFNGTIGPDGKTIAGDFAQAGQTFPFKLEKEAEDEAAEAKQALDAQLQMIRAYIDSTMGAWNTPGVAMAIVKGDEVILSEGFGFRDVEKQLPVTDRTLFAIGSSSKAFTATSVGLMVSDGKLDWDTPVREYLYEFRLDNEYASENMTPRDLLSHRSGLPRHDFVWYGSAQTRGDLFSGLRHLEFSEDFRSTWQYQNLMFMTAGYLVGKAAGSSWEDVVRTRIFEPLGMTNSNFSVTTSQTSSDFALPYGMEDEKAVLIPFRNIDEIGPAGSINSSVSEMINWVRIQLRDGKLGDTEVIPSEVIDETHAPQMVISGRRSSIEYFHNLYGLGWFIQPYRGHMRIHHGGSIDGFQALVSFFPDDDIGMVVLTNRGGSPMPSFASLYATDLLLDIEPVDWHGRALARRAMSEEDGDEEEESQQRVEGTELNHELNVYTGAYRHPAYGTITVEEGDDDQLVARFNGFVFDLEHWHFEMFRGTARDAGELSFMFTFETNAKGDVSDLEVPFEPTVGSIEFGRIPDDKLSSPEYLRSFVGEYDLRGTKITVAMKGSDVLTLAVPGQPTYTLEPYKENGFDLGGLNGFSVVFTMEDGVATEVAFHQPNGVFTAKRSTEE